jgi:hypothetical protein
MPDAFQFDVFRSMTPRGAADFVHCRNDLRE